MAEQSQALGALDDLTRWAEGQGLRVRAISHSVEVVTPGSIGQPLIERRGASKDEAAWYIINCLSRFGVEVPR